MHSFAGLLIWNIWALFTGNWRPPEFGGTVAARGNKHQRWHVEMAINVFETSQSQGGVRDAPRQRHLQQQQQQQNEAHQATVAWVGVKLMIVAAAVDW